VLQDPSGHREALDRTAAYLEALRAGDAVKCRELVTTTPWNGPARGLLLELALRERLHLLRGFLESQQLTPALVAPQVSPDLWSARQLYADQLPKTAAPREPLLELAMLYDRAASEPLIKLASRSQVQPGTSEWERANEELHVSFSEAELATQCARVVKAKPVFKKLCALLTESGPAPR